MVPRRTFLILALLLASAAVNGETGDSFAAFLEALWPDAANKGITRATFDMAFAGMTADAAVLAAMHREPEYGKPFGAYLAGLASSSRIATGLRKSVQWAVTLRAVEDKFGVDQSILVSIWGIESSFGEGEQRWDVFRSIATLAQARFSAPAVSRRALERAEDLAGRSHRATGVRRLVGGRDGAAAIPAVELSEIRRRF